mgnify:FL=1
MTVFKKVQENDITKLAALASKIWHEYWTEILTESQIEYMLENFQSVNAIEKQIAEERYNYYFISDENNENIGYFGISNKENYMFLSKLYLLKEYRRKGIGKAAFEKIKQLAAKENLTTIRLTVNKYNTNTINAYKKWGFIITDAVITDIGSGFVMDDYIMEYYL